MNHQEIAHRWANQIKHGRSGKPEANGNAVYYSGPTIYSYGAHYPAGHLHGKTAYINEQGYSNSTSKHLGHIRNAVNPSTHPESFSVSTSEIMKNIISATEISAPEIVKKLRIMSIRYGIGDKIKTFKKGFKGLKWERYCAVLDTFNAVRREQGKAPFLYSENDRSNQFIDWKNEHEEKLTERREKKEKEDSRKWDKYCLKSKIESIKGNLRFFDPATGENKQSNERRYYSEPITLQIDGNRVRTSNHAEVSLKSAKTLLLIWNNALKTRKTYSDKTKDIDGIKGVCIRRNGTVKIGCTRILPDAVRKLSFELQGV